MLLHLRVHPFLHLRYALHPVVLLRGNGHAFSRYRSRNVASKSGTRNSQSGAKDVVNGVNPIRMGYTLASGLAS